MTVRSLEGGAVRLRPRRIVVPAVGFVLGLAMAAMVVTAAAADGPSTRIVVEPPIASPGDELSIHGEALWTDDTVSASIVGRAGAARPIGTAMTLGSGALEMRARVPDDMPRGVYEVVVTSSSGASVSVELVIEPELPLLPLVAIAGAFAVVALVVVAGMRRQRATSDPLPQGRRARAEPAGR